LQTHFILDRAHYAECFDQSMLLNGPKKPRYGFIALSILAGLFFLFFTHVQGLLAWFFFGIAILEYFSFKYRRSWWLARQMLSKNAGNKITLIFNELGIESKSVYINNLLAWESIESVDENAMGYRFTLSPKGQQYLSKSCLDENIILFIQQKLAHKQWMKN
jgi:hypothetical protein